MKKLMLIFILVSSKLCGIAQPFEDSIHLAAFSMNAAKNEIARNNNLITDEINHLGYISRIWAAFIDDKNDLVLIGERDENWPLLTIGDVVTSLKTRNLITGGENPGVSIEPFNPNRDLDKQKVVYTGGIEGTNYGKVVFEADLLLKLLSLGYLESGIDGLPNEWDLSIDNIKANRGSNPWDYIRNRSWFFPYNVNYIRDDNLVALSSITIRIDNEGNKFIRLPSRTAAYDEESMQDLLTKDPLAVGPIYSKLLSQEFNTLRDRFPVLKSLENLFTLSGLFSELLKDTIGFESLNYWVNDYTNAQVETPHEIPTLRRYKSGIAYTYGVSGEVTSNFSVIDSWSEELLFRTPHYLKEGANQSRPNENAVSWVIPFGYKSPDQWSESLITSLNTSEYDRIQSLLTSWKDLTTTTYTAEELNNLKPVPTKNWKPRTKGDNFLGFNTTLDVNIGGMEYYDPSKTLKWATNNQSIALIPEIRLVFLNKFGISLDWPFVLYSILQDEPYSLNTGTIIDVFSGKSKTKWTVGGGLSSPTLRSRIMLWDGLSNFKFKYPEIVLTNSLTIPVSFRLFKSFIIGEEHFTAFGTNVFLSNHGLDIRFRFRPDFQIQSSIFYERKWGESKTESLFPSLALLFRFDHDNDLYFVLSNQKVYENNIELAKMSHQYSVYNLSFYYPRKFGYNNIGVGFLSFDKSIGAKGGLVFNITFGGDLLFDNRKWFGNEKL
jgi:hypothetical protein